MACKRGEFLFPERSSRQRRRSVMNVMSESVQFDRQTENFSFSDDAGWERMVRISRPDFETRSRKLVRERIFKMA